MRDNLPIILDQCLKYNQPDVGIIANKLKLPWLKLGLTAPGLTQDYIDEIDQMAMNWRSLWNFDLEEIRYQVKGWNGNILFGPKDLKVFLEQIQNQDKWKHNFYDEDCQCKFFRQDFEFDWTVGADDPIRKWVNELVDDKDVYLVNTYFLPPGGFLFPHRDYSIFKDGLAKIYIPVQWPHGSSFGIYGVGNIPLRERDVYLINNYSLPHWVYNGSDQKRMVISIGANLNSPKLSNLIIDSFKTTFGIVD